MLPTKQPTSANLERFSRIPPNQEFFFKNPALSLFCLYSPLTSCKKLEKSLEPFLRKLSPTNQPTNYYQQNQLYRNWLTPIQKSYKFTLNLQFWGFLCDIWRGISHNLYKIFSWNFQDYNILYIVTTWQIFIRLWDGSCPSLKNLHHFAWNDPGVFQSHLFWNLKDLVLVQTLCYRKENNLLPIIDLFFPLTNFNADVRHMLYSHIALQLPSVYMHQWLISPANDNDVELNRQFSFLDWSKSNIVRLTQVKSEDREVWHAIFTTYIL